MLDKHEDTDFSEVQWGMSILGKKRSAFERQITEAVTIMKESRKHDILNSKAEWSQCSLPRLTSRMGDKDLKEMEKEIRIEKEKESKFEEKVRKLRKERNRARIHQGGNTASKRQKINEEEYISIREVWGPPERNAPGKKKLREDEDEKENERNVRTKIIEPVASQGVPEPWEPNYEEEKVNRDTKEIEKEEEEKTDWDIEIKKHKEELENELEKKREKEKLKIKEEDYAWKFFSECKDYLEDNNKYWEARRRKREEDRKREERLSIANQKRENIKEKILERKLEKDVEERMKQLPESERNRIENEEKKNKRNELKEMKASLWKLKSRKKKLERKSEKMERIERIEKLEDKLKMVIEISKELKEEEEKLQRENREIERKIENEKKKTKETKLRKEKAKIEKEGKEKILGERWGMMEWLVEYINENQEKWEKERKEREEAERKEILEWEKAKRFEKIKILKRKWEKEREGLEVEEKENEKEINKTEKEKWTVWRKKGEDKHQIISPRINIEISTSTSGQNENLQSSPTPPPLPPPVRPKMGDRVGKEPDNDKNKDKILNTPDKEGTDKTENKKTTKIVTLKPPSKNDDPKTKKKNNNKNTKKDKNDKDKNEDTKTRKISDMFGKKSITKNDKLQRQVASKEDKNVSSSQLDYDCERVPLDNVGKINNFKNIPDSVKPDLAENKKTNIFPANNLGESSCQISESQPN